MNMFLIKKRQVYYNFNNKNRRINNYPPDMLGEF